MGYRIFCEAFWGRRSNRPSSQVVGKKIFLGDAVWDDLYHPRARRWAELCWEVEAHWRLVDFRFALLPPALSYVGGRPCTTPDAWLYRELFNGIAGWPSAWQLAEPQPARNQPPPACTVRCRRLQWDDWA